MTSSVAYTSMTSFSCSSIWDDLLSTKREMSYLNPHPALSAVSRPKKHSGNQETTQRRLLSQTAAHTHTFISGTTRLPYSAFVFSFALTDHFNTSPLCRTSAVPFLIFHDFMLRVESFAFSGHVHSTEGWIGRKPTFLLSYTPQIRQRHMSRTLHYGMTVTSTWADFF